MGNRVYHLKHATPRMKYIHMMDMIDWKADLKEKQMVYALEQLRQRQTELMAELIDLDLAWEEWFDDNENVPEYGPMRERVAILERRVAELKVFQPLACIAGKAS